MGYTYLTYNEFVDQTVEIISLNFKTSSYNITGSSSYNITGSLILSQISNPKCWGNKSQF